MIGSQNMSNSPKITHKNGTAETVHRKEYLDDDPPNYFKATTVKSITKTIVVLCSIDTSTKNSTPYITVTPFSNNELNKTFQIVYDKQTNPDTNDYPTFEESVYTPDLSDCVVQKITYRCSDGFYPVPLKIVSNNSKYNRIPVIDAKHNIKYISCPLYHNKMSNNESIILETPDHAMEAKCMFMTKYPVLSKEIIEKRDIIMSDTVVNVGKKNPLYVVLLHNREQGNISSLSNNYQNGYGEVTDVIAYKKADFENITTDILAKRERNIARTNLHEINFTISRMDDRNLNDPIGTPYSNMPNEFHNLKEIFLSMEFKVTIDVAITDEVIDISLFRDKINIGGLKLNKDPDVKHLFPYDTREKAKI